MYFFPNLEPAHCSMSSPNCCFLTCIPISQEAGKVVWYSHLLKNFLQFVLIHTVKDFSIANETEVNVFLQCTWFFCDPSDVGSLISGSSAFSKSNLYIWKFLVHVLLKPGLENFEHDFASMWNECNCVEFEHSLALPFFGIGIKLTFPSPVATTKFSKFAGVLSAIFEQHNLLGFELAQLEFHHLH